MFACRKMELSLYRFRHRKFMEVFLEVRLALDDKVVFIFSEKNAARRKVWRRSIWTEIGKKAMRLFLQSICAQASHESGIRS